MQEQPNDILINNRPTLKFYITYQHNLTDQLDVGAGIAVRKVLQHTVKYLTNSVLELPLSKINNLTGACQPGHQVHPSTSGEA